MKEEKNVNKLSSYPSSFVITCIPALLDKCLILEFDDVCLANIV